MIDLVDLALTLDANLSVFCSKGGRGRRQSGAPSHFLLARGDACITRCILLEKDAWHMIKARRSHGHDVFSCQIKVRNQTPTNTRVVRTYVAAGKHPRFASATGQLPAATIGHNQQRRSYPLMRSLLFFPHFLVQIKPAEAAVRTAVVSLACAAVELLPPRLAGDDNISVPITALVVGRLLF